MKCKEEPMTDDIKDSMLIFTNFRSENRRISLRGLPKRHLNSKWRENEKEN